jgi:hypothetical protein
MKVTDRCDGCRAWGECHWSLDPILKLCAECFVARFGYPPEVHDA